MNFPKHFKDVMYTLLNQPTLEKFREFLTEEIGEHNAIDFKREWISKDKLAKLMLSLANYGGGVVIFGVEEKDNNTFECVGLKELKAKEELNSSIKSYISPNLDYDLYDFKYETSEYELLNGKSFQMLVVNDTPQFLPFICKRDGASINESIIYIRRGTSDEQITEEELSKILERRMKYIYPLTGKPLELDEHLKQLQTLYNNTNQQTKLSLSGVLSSLLSFGVTDNKYYPKESYEEFIANMIDKKKEKIKKVLDLN